MALRLQELPSVWLSFPSLLSHPIWGLLLLFLFNSYIKPGPTSAWISSVPWPNSQTEENNPIPPGSHPPNQQEHCLAKGMSNRRFRSADVPSPAESTSPNPKPMRVEDTISRLQPPRRVQGKHVLLAVKIMICNSVPDKQHSFSPQCDMEESPGKQKQ